jgi:hypothetical protein
MKKRTAFLLLIVILVLSCTHKLKVADKPLVVDPVFNGAADPVVTWNKEKKEWWMFYTNRRANIEDSTVKWVHGTRIGIAASKNGAHWHYVDTANINYRPDKEYTFWAPEIVREGDHYHMFLTYVPGIFTDWNHPRSIIHLTSSDLLNWQYQSTLKLSSDKVIDPCVIPLPGGGWRLWYNNEKDKKTIYYADSKDLYNWQDKGLAIAARGEGPKVFHWQNTNWMIIDVWKGMEVYRSDDLLHWKKQANRILEQPGKGKDDAAMGGHCDVVVNDNRAYVFYFTHPGRSKQNPAAANSIEAKRSVIQVVELKYENGELNCNRDQPTLIDLKKPLDNNPAGIKHIEKR